MSMPMLSMTGTFLSNQILPIKGKWEALRQRRLNISDLSVTRENDPTEARETPVSEVDEDMQMLNTDNNKVSSTTPTSNKAPPEGTLAWTEAGQQQVQEDDCNKNGGKYNRSMLPGGYSVAEPPSTSAVSCAPSSAVDDEMLSWLQYPMDENFEKSYCSELFGDVPSSSMQTYSSNNTSNNSHSNGNTRRSLVVTATNSTSVANVQKPPNAAAAMALGAERAAGLSSQVGHEAFCRVRTSVQPPVPKWPGTMPPAPSTTDIVSELHQHSKSLANFPMYVPVTSAPSNFVVLQGPVHHANSKTEKSRSLIAESAAAAPPQRHESVENAPVKKEQLGSFISAGGSSKTKSVENDEIHHKNTGHKRYEAEATITSSSGGSENTTEKSEKAERVAEKRKAKQMSESTECQSEDVEGDSVDTKKPVRPKRSRAAEVHNLSERRRRDRINEKMRALQELIPNSNKTDKASMLDEAIEYLKMLQLQLQMMSMRSGMTLPPMVMPSGVQAMQMPHITALAPYGAGMVGGCMNMNMGMGMGMNMVDMAGNSSIRPLHLQTIQHSEPLQQQQQHQHQHQQLLQHQDSYSVYVSQPQMQVPVQMVNRDMYSSYMLPMAPPGPQQTNNKQQQQQQQPHSQQQHPHQHQHQQQLHPGQQPHGQQPHHGLI